MDATLHEGGALVQHLSEGESVRSAAKLHNGGG
jgi:hypothetical protein